MSASLDAADLAALSVWLSGSIAQVRVHSEALSEERIREIFAADFCSDAEGSGYIREAFEQGHLIDPHTATCFKTCAAPEFVDQVNLVYSTAEWTKFAPVVDQAINGNAPGDDLASLRAIAVRAGIEIPPLIAVLAEIADLFERDVHHDRVVARTDIEAEILEFLRS